MVTEEFDESMNGWPLGLQVMNSRLRAATDSFPSLHIPSASFSSLSSSELDTVSTASFFQDHSVSLGRLIGINPANKTWLYLPTDETEPVSVNSARLDARKSNDDNEISRKICIPIVIGVILKMTRSRKNSRS